MLDFITFHIVDPLADEDDEDEDDEEDEEDEEDEADEMDAFVVNAPGQSMIKMFGKYETLLLTVLMIFLMSIFLLILSILFQIRALINVDKRVHILFKNHFSHLENIFF